MKLLDKETKAGFKWSTVHDGFSIHDCKMQFHLILAWISDDFMCCETRSNIATGLSDAERYSIRKWCGTRPKTPLEINHAMRTTNFATEHFPLPTCRNFRQKMKNS